MYYVTIAICPWAFTVIVRTRQLVGGLLVRSKKSTPAALCTANTDIKCLETPSFGLEKLESEELVTHAKMQQTREEELRELAHYCIVKNDLTVGSKAAMLIHAAGESAPGNMPLGMFAIALETDAATLGCLEKRLIEEGVEHSAFREPDLGNQLVAIGICPDHRQKVRRFVSNLPLIK